MVTHVARRAKINLIKREENQVSFSQRDWNIPEKHVGHSVMMTKQPNPANKCRIWWNPRKKKSHCQLCVKGSYLWRSTKDWCSLVNPLPSDPQHPRTGVRGSLRQHKKHSAHRKFQQPFPAFSGWPHGHCFPFLVCDKKLPFWSNIHPPGIFTGANRVTEPGIVKRLHTACQRSRSKGSSL